MCPITSIQRTFPEQRKPLQKWIRLHKANLHISESCLFSNHTADKLELINDRHMVEKTEKPGIRFQEIRKRTASYT